MPRMDCTKEIAGVSTLSVEQIMGVLAYKYAVIEADDLCTGLIAA